jgi:hypothetical protein
LKAVHFLEIYILYVVNAEAANLTAGDIPTLAAKFSSSTRRFGHCGYLLVF